MTTNYLRVSRKAGLLKLFIFAAIILTMGMQRSFASHAAGGHITYTHLTGNQYLFHFSYYRDCAGIPAPSSVVFYVQSVTCNVGNPTPLTFTATSTGGVEITYPCSTSQTTCSGGSNPGIQRYEYETTIALPGQCPDWRVWTYDCCRNNAITTLQNPGSPGIYIEARLNNSVTDNNSPQFSVDPILFVCTNANFAFNNGAIDPDGDSLVYSFIAPREDANTNCAYVPGYSVINPISSSPAVSINTVTGDVFMHPTAIEVGVIVVLITEYRNGLLLGSVMRDIQIYTVPCTNTAPSTGGINGTGVFQTNACAGTTICFDIPSTDPDAGQVLTMTWSGTIPAATFTTTGSPFPTGHFCWTTTANDARPQPYAFTVTIRDDNCPSNGVQVYSFNIYVGGGLTAAVSSTPVACNGGTNGTATCNVTGGGTGPFTYLWSPGQLTGQTITGLAAGTYTVFVTDPSGCQTTQSVTVSQPAAMSTSIQNIVDASCGTLGSFDIVTTGGSPVYTYYTNTVPPSTGSSVTAGAGTYTVTVRDANNCRTLSSVTIGGGGTIQASETHTDVTCNGDDDGTANVNVTGGSGNETYTWTPNVSTTSSASGLGAGTYTVDVSNGSCSTQVVIIITEPAVLNSGETHTNVSCNGAADGSISLTVSGGTGSYQYAWTPNVSSGATASGLGGGTYEIDITDDNGCITSQTVVINEATAIALNLSSTPASCLLTNGSATVIASGGSGSYTYSWSPVAGAGSTLSNIGVGTYTVVVTDGNGCTETGSVNVNSTGLSAIVSSQTDATCEGGDDGAATVTASGGQTPYTYLWSPTGGTAASATGLSPGQYSVTVTDYLGCQTIVIVTIGFINPAPALDLGADTTLCLGVTYTLDAGAGYSYLWSDNSTGQTLDVTASGTYGVVITDGNGCQSSDMVTITYIQCIIPQGHHNGNTGALTVYPNPASEFLSVSISNITNENVKMELSDLLGNKVFFSNERSGYGYKHDISLANLPVGIYMLKVQYLDKVKTVKVVRN